MIQQGHQAPVADSAIEFLFGPSALALRRLPCGLANTLSPGENLFSNFIFPKASRCLFASERKMGYYETYCQLCGVSFAIARHRRADEPPSAAWDYTGSTRRIQAF